MTTPPAPIVALVDDDASLAIAIANLLRSAGFDVVTFASAEQFLESAHRESIRCAILDLGLPGMDGLELLMQLRASGWDIPIVCTTGQPDPDGRLAKRALQAGARSILYKPFDSEALFSLLQSDDVLRPTAEDLDNTRTESCSGARRS